MFRKCLSILLVSMLWIPMGALAAEVDSDSIYCFTQEDFSAQEEPLAGICITGLPDSGTLLLGNRVLRPGDILTDEQVSAMTFVPASTETDASAQVDYLPIYELRA